MCSSWSSSDEAVVDSTINTTSTSTSTNTTMDTNTKSSSLNDASTTCTTDTKSNTQPQPQPQSMTNKNKNKKQRLSNSSSNALQVQVQVPSPKHKIYCDLDGVLVDFDRGVMQLTGGQHPDRMPVGRMWAAVSRKPKFFQQLPWTRDGKRLWHAIQQLQPDNICILTGVPSNRPEIVGQQKATWCRRELGIDVHHLDMAGKDKRKQNAHIKVAAASIGTSASTSAHTRTNDNRTKINVISCWSRFKYKECKNPGDILIDDRQKFQHDWEQAGGIFVHHVQTETTLTKLRELGAIIRGKEADIQRAPPSRDFLQDERPETP